VGDLTQFYRQYRSIKPWLQRDTPAPDGRENLQSPQDRAKLDGLYECILCACCFFFFFFFWGVLCVCVQMGRIMWLYCNESSGEEGDTRKENVGGN
jgi:hypothetical protein